MTFTWTQEQRDSVVPCATVCVEGSPTYDAGRYTIVGKVPGFAIIRIKGVDASVPWARLDPDTLLLPPDPRQTLLFGGDT